MIDPELAVLASTAGATVVQLLATDGWAASKRAVGALWQRFRPEHAGTVTASIESDHRRIVAARSSGDEAAETLLFAEWQRRFQDLLAADPKVRELLQKTLDEELTPALSGRSDSSVEMHATSYDSSNIYQAARDQHFGR